jgi:DNA-binding LacI/PurR family transcriptional regulator
VAEDRAEGFLILTFLPIAPGDVAPLIWAGVPFVLVNRHFGANPVNCVVVDFAAAMSGAVDHLVRLGHRRIATLLPDDAWSAIQDRASGWREGVRRNGLAEAAAPIIHFALPEGEAGHALGRRLLTGGLPGSGSVPTAIVGYNDFCAHGVLAAAAELGVAVPSSLSVIGFDDIIAPYTSPPLCSYGPAPLALGMAAVDRLVLLLAGGNPEPTRTALSAELVCRGTCGAPP